MNLCYDSEDKENYYEECREEEIAPFIYITSKVYKLFAGTKEKEVWKIFKESILFWEEFSISKLERTIIINAAEGTKYCSIGDFEKSSNYDEEKYEENFKYACSKISEEFAEERGNEF